ncbi:MAG: 6,7-dimethyl-8-ribityllumazine synthase [Acidobacteriota bacterium]
MVKEFAGSLGASGLRIGFVVGRFNSSITEKLLEAGLDAYRRAGGADENAVVLRVPGSFEIPVAARRLAEAGEVDAIVCVGCLIRGETPHFDYLSREVTRGIDEVALRYGLPVTYGVLTTDTVEQALNRSGIKHGNKGVDATLAAIEMVNLFRELSGK